MTEINDFQNEETTVQEQSLDHFIEEAYRRYAEIGRASCRERV